MIGYESTVIDHWVRFKLRETNVRRLTYIEVNEFRFAWTIYLFGRMQLRVQLLIVGENKKSTKILSAVQVRVSSRAEI